jgi:hypothetical protein
VRRSLEPSPVKNSVAGRRAGPAPAEASAGAAPRAGVGLAPDSPDFLRPFQNILHGSVALVRGWRRGRISWNGRALLPTISGPIARPAHA